MKPIPFVYQNNTISLVVKNQTYVVSRGTHMNYDRIYRALQKQQWAKVAKLVDMQKQMKDFTRGKIEVRNGEMYWKGEVFHNALSTRIMDMYREGFPVDAMLEFMKNLMKNPSKRAVDELYLFLEKGQLPITPDGHFLAYKRVRSDYTDLHTGNFDNSVGATPKMERNQVDEDKDRTCSEGLHFCSLEYLPHFGSRDCNPVMIVKINPRDVVSIPADYDNTKGRCCRYEVVGEHGVNDAEKTHAFTSSVVNPNTY